jgi:endonuclease-3
MLMKQQGHSYLGRHRNLHPRLCSWWKVIIFLSSSSFSFSLTLSLSSHRSISSFSPIADRAVLYYSPYKISFDRRRATTTTSMTLFPVTPAGKYSSPTGSSLRRSNRISNKNCDVIMTERNGVRLFQEGSAGVENENENEGGNNSCNDNRLSSSVNLVSADISNDDEGSVVPTTTRSKKCESRSASSSIGDESAGKMAKRRRSGIAPTVVSTPARGPAKAIPVTPEPVGVEKSSDSARQWKTKTKTRVPAEATATTKAKTKTTKAKTIVKAKAKTATKTKKKASRVVASWPAPDGWRETYELVRELRKDKTAPCDIMGAEALALPPPDRNDNDNGDIDVGVGVGVDDEEYAKTCRFQTLIALMLSSQTKDAMVGQAMGNLRDTSDGSGGLTVASILEMDPKVLNAKIYSVGFRNNKTKYIKQVAQILHDDYNDDIPPTADQMIRDLSGVGPKMAYIVENVCWGKQTGIGVDTHMQRLFPKLGWVSPDTKNPEQTRKQLESWLPQEYWGEVNLLWVGFGQEVQQEKQKVLRKALQYNRPFEALSLLRSVGFDVVKEWNKMQSDDSSTLDEEKKIDLLWSDDNERKKISKMIEEIMSQK